MDFLPGAPKASAAIIKGLPVILGTSSVTNITGTAFTDYQLALPSRAQVGQTFNYYQINVADTPSTVTSGGTTLGYVQRASAALFSNYTVGMANKILTATDVTNGYLVIPTVGDSTALLGFLMWRDKTYVHSLSPMSSGATATTGFTRPAAADQNTVASVSLTPTTPVLAFSVLAWQGGSRTLTMPTGYTTLYEAQPASTSTSRRCIAVAVKTITDNSASGTDVWTFSGAATLRPTTFTTTISAL